MADAEPPYVAKPGKIQEKDGIQWRDVSVRPWLTPNVMTVTNAVGGLHGFSVREKRSFDGGKWKKPDKVYFIYMRLNENQRLYVRHYLVDLMPGEAIEGFEKRFATDVRDGTVPGLPPVEVDMRSLQFGNTPCYVSFFLDEAEWKIHPWPENEFEETVVFRESKMIHWSTGSQEGGTVEYYDKNFSFFNFERYTLAMTNKRTGVVSDRQGFRFVNFMKKDEGGNPIALGRKPFISMDIYLKMPYERNADEPQRWLTIVYDPPEPPIGSVPPPPPPR